MDKQLEDAFNDHLNVEFYSSYLYLSMANYFAFQNLGGMARWMVSQAGEERTHALKLIEHVHARGGRVRLKQIDQPQLEWAGPLDAFQDAYKHECDVSGKINNLVDVAIAQRDHAAHAFLQWFVGEQVEEEATALGIVEKLKLVGENAMGILMMDHQLGSRTAAG